MPLLPFASPPLTLGDRIFFNSDDNDAVPNVAGRSTMTEVRCEQFGIR
jgi:hypothetical protein